MNNLEQDEVVVTVQFTTRTLEEVSTLGPNHGVITRANPQNKLKRYTNVSHTETSLDEP